MAGERVRRISRRGVVFGLLGGAGRALASGRVSAPDDVCLKNQTIRWLVGYTPGGGYDTYARLVEPFLERALGARIMIQNLPGAAGAVALRTLADARPDGRTIGIFDGPGALLSVAMRQPGVPDLGRDLTILGRVARLQQMVVTGPRTGAATLEDLLRLGRQRRLVFGATATGSQNFVTCAVTDRLFGLDAEFVVGYPGSRELTLGLIRGDFDAMSVNVESGLDAISSDGIAPLFVVTPDALPYARFGRVPRLGSTDGLARRRPGLFAIEPDEAQALVDAVTDYLGFGRVVAAPAGLRETLRRCLADGLSIALRDPALAAAAERAQRTLAAATADQARRQLDAAHAAVMRIAPIAAEAARRAR